LFFHHPEGSGTGAPGGWAFHGIEESDRGGFPGTKKEPVLEKGGRGEYNKEEKESERAEGAGWR